MGTPHLYDSTENDNGFLLEQRSILCKLLSMIELLRERDFTRIGHYQSILEGEGIRTFMRNANLSSTEVSIPAFLPVLCILDPDDHQRAWEVLRSYLDSTSIADSGEEWECPACHEMNPPSFDLCWSCQTARDPANITPMPFVLNPRLAAGSFEFGRIGISRLLLKNNALFPWFILVPEVEVEDLHQLTLEEYREVTAAIRNVSQFMADHFKPEKLNVACIGNQVRQMHIHLIARWPTDPAWPDPVWGFPEKEPYESAQIDEIRAAVTRWLAGNSDD
jgi:diadenosine tetraphosphate (Ap4A) HIT family hydrolase